MTTVEMHPTYAKLDAQLQGRNAAKRRVDNNTWLERRGDNIAVRLHKTDVITVEPSGRITVQTGGWFTPTTKDRINQYTGAYQIVQRNGQWYWRIDGQSNIPFTDGDGIEAQGTLFYAATVADEHSRAKMLKDITAYAKLLAAALPLDPHGHDACPQCKAFHEVDDPEHWMIHIRAGHIIPDLVKNALKAHGCSETPGEPGSAWPMGAFAPSDGWAKEHQGEYARFIQKYLRQKLGLPR